MPRTTANRAAPANRRTAAPARAVANGLTGEDVVQAALRVVERDGVEGLTMRRLADELGAAVTAIYWHVGNRDALVDLLVERLLAEMGDIRPRGRGAHRRIAGLAHELRKRLLARPHLIGLADQRGKTAAMFQPVQAALADELATLGITGEDAARAIQLLQYHVVASVVFSRAVARSRPYQGTDPAGWKGRREDPELLEALAREPDFDADFDIGLEALLDRVLPG